MLTPAQQERIEEWFPTAELVADLSWPEALTRVLRLRTPAGDVVVKAAGEVMAGHVPRGIAAGRELRGPGLPELLAASEPDRILALRFQPGELVQDTPAEDDPAVFAAVGRLLATVHGSAAPVVSDEYPRYRLRWLRDWLPRVTSLVDPALAGELAAAVERIVAAPEPAVRTHGDMQPRNWLVDGDQVRLIDFGRYAVRPAYTDLVRVWHRYPPGDPRVDALLDGLGGRTWDGAGWWAEHLYQGVSTVVWASDRGFDDFAEDGRRMLRRTLGGTMDR